MANAGSRGRMRSSLRPQYSPRPTQSCTRNRFRRKCEVRRSAGERERGERKRRQPSVDDQGSGQQYRRNRRDQAIVPPRRFEIASDRRLNEVGIHDVVNPALDKMRYYARVEFPPSGLEQDAILYERLVKI